MTAHNAFGDIADRYDGPDPSDLLLEQIENEIDADADRMCEALAEIEDPGAYATDEEYHASVWADADPALDLTDLLESPCLLPIADDLGSYAHLSGHLSNLELTSDAAVELRARVRKDAA